MQLRRWQSEAIQAALDKFQSGRPHFLCLATPGAGKTHMASMLAKQMLEASFIDLIVCFSPSINVAAAFQVSLESCLQARMNGLLGSKGRVLTYQSMLHLNTDFWALFSQYRILVIFDEIHHCAGDKASNANAWGQTILQSIQGRASYTLALTGTPWRSDQVPIVLATYCQLGKVQCDFHYGLNQAIIDGVCRIPQITAIDNEQIQIKSGHQIETYTSFADLLSNSFHSYQQLLRSNELIEYLLRIAAKKLDHLRQADPTAGALIVAASVEHALHIADLLQEKIGESAVIVTYLHDEAHTIIRDFRDSKDKWIISVGMISEGTDIPRLKVCCHLTHVKTELYFRQVMGRILRSNNSFQEVGYLFMPAEPTLMGFAQRIAEDIPEVGTISIEQMPPLELPLGIEESDLSESQTLDAPPLQPEQATQPSITSELDITLQPQLPSSPLSDNYDATLGLFGKFQHRIFQLAGQQ